jgi:hypothetical protein
MLKKKLNTFLKILSLILIIVVVPYYTLAISFYIVTQPRRDIESKLDRAKADLYQISVGVHGVYVDDGGGLRPGLDNYLPNRLTSPISYLTSLPKDPFSQTDETYRMIGQTSEEYPRSNYTQFILVSQGPDMDWDIEKLPFRINAPRFESIGYGIRVSENQPLVPEKLIALPRPYYRLKSGEVRKYLFDNKVSMYDPTNGLMSDGDIIYIGKR